MALTPAMQALVKAEITADPTGRGYSGQTVDQQAALINAGFSVLGLASACDVAVGAVEGYLRARLLFGAIQKFVASPPQGAPAELVEGLSELLGMIQSPHVDFIAMTDPTVNAAVTAILGAAVAAGLISAQNRADLLAMAMTAAPVTVHHARVLDIFIGVDGAPNELTADDITGALAA